VSDTLGWIYYKKNVYVKAIGLLKDSTEKLPNNPVYHYHLGMAYVKNGDTALAKQALTRALQGGRDLPGKQEAQEVLATLQYREGDLPSPRGASVPWGVGVRARPVPARALRARDHGRGISRPVPTRVPRQKTKTPASSVPANVFAYPSLCGRIIQLCTINFFLLRTTRPNKAMPRRTVVEASGVFTCKVMSSETRSPTLFPLAST